MEPSFALETGTRSLSDLPNFRAVSLPCPRPLLYRSGYIERLSAEGISELARRVRCVVDLRGGRELRRTLPGSHVTSSGGFRQLLLRKDGSVADLDGRPVADPLTGRRRLTIDFLGMNFFARMFLKLPPHRMLDIGWSLVTSLYTGDRGYEAKAAEIVLKPRGLVGQGQDFVDFCQSELAAVLRVLAQSDNLPCLVHCFLGKDRTGLVAMLLQWLLELPLDTIEGEYALSQSLTESVRQEAVRYYAEKNLPPSFAECSVDELRAVMSHIRDRYGGVESYMREIGLTQWEIDQVRSNFGKNSTVGLLESN